MLRWLPVSARASGFIPLALIAVPKILHARSAE
jgi:hypothetical protein